MLEFSGEQNHAGTTPMSLRKDAALEMFRLAVELDAAFRTACDEASVWTFGRLSVEPNAASIIPGRALLNVQFRDPREAVLERLGQILQDVPASRSPNSGVGVRILREVVRLAPTPLDPTLQEHVREAARALAPGSWMDMSSGAGHDAQILQQLMPAAMLFIPSVGGVSHSFAEDSRAEDIVLGCEVAAEVVARLLLR